jgi:hypothetical protein
LKEELNALPIWITVIEYNFKEHTLKAKFLDSKIELNFRLNAVFESQLLKLIDSGKSPKKIRVFIDGSDILALDTYSEELSENLETLAPEELERRLKLGYYPKGKIEELSKKLKTELRIRVSSSESGLVLYYDSECTRKISIISLEGEGIGETRAYTFYLRNEGEPDLTEIKFSCENPQINLMNFSRELKSGEKGEIVLAWTQSSEKKALETSLNVSANEIYRAKGVPEAIEVIRGKPI